MTSLLNERVMVLLALLLIAAALYASSFAQSFTDVGDAHSPVFFPRIILMIWMGLTVIALAQGAVQDGPNPPIAGLRRLGVLIVATVIYTNLLTVYGFFLTSFAFALICLPVFGIRRPVIVLAFALAVPGALVVLFNHLLGMPLPTSPFTHYF